jgi:hypothetical protein
MSSLLAIVVPLWSSLVALLQSIDWLSLGAFLAATGLLSLVAKLWTSRGLWGAKVPFLAAAFELLDVFGFSPVLLAEWVRRRSWYRRGAGEVDRVRRVWPSSVVVLFVVSCSPSSSGVCPVFDVSKVTLPAALALTRTALEIASDVCGDGCPSELSEARRAIGSGAAAIPEVCRALDVVKSVPCERCASPISKASAMVDCHGIE